jgi:hypothetical protein
MPQSRSRSRYQRSTIRSRYRKPRRRRGGSLGWNALIAVIVVLGVIAVVLTRGNDSSAGAPRAANANTNTPGDHWHTYLGVDICGEWLAFQPLFEKPADNPNQVNNVGIHTHGDGLIHTHPFVSAEAGSNATVGKFASYAGWSVSSDSINAWTGPASAPTRKSWSNGNTCPFGEFKGKKIQMVWKVDGKVQKGNPSDYHQQDGAIIAIYFVPKGAATPLPPTACGALEKIGDLNGGSAIDKKSPCVPSSTTTTTTTTTAAPPTTAASATTTPPSTSSP